MAEDQMLTWGVKQSFRTYVEGAGGSIQTGGETTRAPDGAFTFPAAGEGGLTLGPDGQLQGQAGFRGEVRFQAHGGMLSVFLADPALEITPAGASLTVADSPARTRRIELARLDLAAATPGDDGEQIIPTRLSPEGWLVLGDHYPPGTPLDPVRVRVGR